MKLKTRLHDNSPTILAGLGVLGFFGSIVMTAKAAPIAEKRLKKLPQNAKLKDKIKLLAPIYAPVAGLSLISTACIIGSNRIHTYRYGSLLALYSIGEKTLQTWQDSTLEEIGKKRFDKVTSRVREPEGEPPASIMVDEERVLFYDRFSGRYFRGDSIESVRKVVNDINERMFAEDFASVNDFYYGIGLDRIEYGDDWGWSIANGAFTVEFDAFIRNERPVVSLTFQAKPRRYKEYK